MANTIKARFVGGPLHNRVIETNGDVVVETQYGSYICRRMQTAWNNYSILAAIFYEYIHESLMDHKGNIHPSVTEESCKYVNEKDLEKLYAHYLRGLSKIVGIKRIMEFVGDTL